MIDNQERSRKDSKLLWLYAAITWVVLWCILVIIPGLRSVFVGIYEFFVSLSRCQEMECIWVGFVFGYTGVLVWSLLLGLILKISGRSWGVALKTTITALVLFILVNLFIGGFAGSLEVISPVDDVGSQQDLPTNGNRPEIEQIISEARAGGQNDQEIREVLMTLYNFPVNEIDRALNK